MARNGRVDSGRGDADHNHRAAAVEQSPAQLDGLGPPHYFEHEVERTAGFVGEVNIGGALG